MPIRCLTSARFTMNAEILRWQGITSGDADDVTEGNWTTYQDPITGEVLNTWVPGQDATTDEPAVEHITIDCLARGVMNGGGRGDIGGEVFGADYSNSELVRLWVPAGAKVTIRDRITNIRSKANGEVVWVDEYGNPIIFNVNLVSPLFDPFNRHTESLVLLQRIDA